MRLSEAEMKKKLEGVSPLQLGDILMKQELYDEKTALEIIEEIDRELKDKGEVIDKVVTPVFYNVADNLVNKNAAIRRMGLTPSRIIRECKEFRYEEAGEGDNVIYLSKAEGEVLENIDEIETRKDENYKKEGRHLFCDQRKLDAYKTKQANDGKNKTVEDEYTGKRIYVKKEDLEKRNFKNSTEQFANTDHIVPIKEKVTELSKNFALTDQDVREIVNIEENLALTNEKLNKSKREQTNLDFIENEASNVKLDETTKEKMVEVHKAANKAMAMKQNEKVIANLKDKEQRDRIAKETASASAKTAVSQIGDATVGDILINMIKVTYYEIKDIFQNGITHGTGKTSKLAAFKYRAKRGMKYVLNSLKDVGSKISEFVKALVGNIFEMIINFVAGTLKSALYIVKRGFTSIIAAIKVLVKPSSEMTAAEKADAITKIGVTAVTLIAGEALEPMVAQVVPPQLAIVVTPLITGVISSVIIYALDKIDLFGASIEVKRRRVKEVFEARIEDIKESVAAFDKAAMEVMLHQRQKFEDITSTIYDMLEQNNVDGLLNASFETASFFGVDLGYDSTESFIDMIKSNDIVEM